MRVVLGFVACTLLLGATVRAQTAEQEYQGWMKSNNTVVADLSKSLTAKDAKTAAADVKMLRENLAKIMAYWQIRNVKDGVRFSLDGTYGFAQVGALASQGKFDEAAAAMKTAQANCGGCHMVHRERAADGTFKIK